jgi:hypothetical protein
MKEHFKIEISDFKMEAFPVTVPESISEGMGEVGQRSGYSIAMDPKKHFNLSHMR